MLLGDTGIIIIMGQELGVIGAVEFI